MFGLSRGQQPDVRMMTALKKQVDVPGEVPMGFARAGDLLRTLRVAGAEVTVNLTRLGADPHDRTAVLGAGRDLRAVARAMSDTPILPCFTPGTRIATARGLVAVEALEVGDLAITRDNGLREVRWVGRTELDWAFLRRNAHLQPVLIRKGALGPGRPDRDMMVSPNHRVLVDGDQTALFYDSEEVLAAAKHLIDHRGVLEVDAFGVTYLQVLFAGHEVILADGVWTESFQPSDFTLLGLGNAQRTEIFELFPELRTPEGVADFAAARRSLRRVAGQGSGD